MTCSLLISGASEIRIVFVIASPSSLMLTGIVFKNFDASGFAIA